MRLKQYILAGHTPVPVTDLITWASWMETGNRVVAQTKLGASFVSTVFLGIDHAWGDGPPVLFETMVFEGPLAREMDRYGTWEEAEAGHAEMVKRVKAATHLRVVRGK